MRNIRLIVEYDGSEFHGWQIQPRLRTVQGELEGAAEVMTGRRPKVRGASRTDAGVHAVGQVACFQTSSDIDTAQFAPGLTTLTGWDLVVRKAEEAPLDWSARFAAKGKIYRYSILNRKSPSPLFRRTTWHVAKPLDLAAMEEASRCLVGEHDFAAFRSASCDAPTTVRHMREVSVRRVDDDLVELRFSATAFLHNMVRILAGTLVAVGKGRLEPREVERIRDQRDRHAAGQTAPAQGLCLVEVHY